MNNQKRHIRVNIYGNWIGYIGKNKAFDFSREYDAKKWLETGTVINRVVETENEIRIKLR